MKAKLIKSALFITMLLLCSFARAQVKIRILTPSGNAISYTLTIGTKKFKCNSLGVVMLTNKQFSKLKDEHVSFNITDPLNRDFYDQITLCTTIDCCYDINSKGGIMLVGLTLKKLMANKNDSFYFRLNKFGQTDNNIPTKTG